MIRLEPGDCLKVIPRLVAEGVVVDAVVTDPPYALIGASDRGKHAMSAVAEKTLGRIVRGFMGKTWDNEIAFKPETWTAVLSILRPGGYLLAFGGTRTHHRMVCAIEDAGFVVQDTIMWLYGSGFPKRRDMLKPAFEPICMAYKPAGKRSLAVDECRIGTEERFNPWRGTETEGWGFKKKSDQNEGSTVTGRWPANVIHDGSDEVMEAFAAYGESKIVVRVSEDIDAPGVTFSLGRTGITPRGHCDTGTAARFFYSAKADKQDRWGSKHPTVKPVELIRYLVKLVTPPGGTFLDPFAGSGTAAVAALAESRNAILIEQDEEYCADIRERIAHYEGEGRHSLAVKNRARQDSQGALL